MMRAYIGVVCCLALLINGALASSASARLSISSKSGPGGSSVSVHHESSAHGPKATAVINSHGSAGTKHSEAVIDQSSFSNSHGGNTDANVNTHAHTIGNGKAHGFADAEAVNHHSDATANHEVVVESDHGGAAAVDGGAGSSSNLHGSDGEIINSIGSIGAGSAAVKSVVTGGNYEGQHVGKQHLVGASDAGGSTDAHGELLSGFNHYHGSRLGSFLKGLTRNGASILGGNEGAAVGKDGVSAGKSNLNVESHGGRHFRGDRRSYSYGLIEGGTRGGMNRGESTADAEGEVVKDGTVGATIEIGSQGDYKDNGVKASLIIDAEEPDRPIPRPRSRRRRMRQGFRRL